MAKISGWIFIAVGAAVALFSRYVQKRGGEGLGLFFWAGIIMIGIGIFKIVIGFILREKKSEKEREQERKEGGFAKLNLNKDLQSVNMEEIEQERQKALRNIQESNILVCPACGTKHYSNSNFCHICGSRLK